DPEAAQDLTALAVADRDAAILAVRSDAAASEALYFESISDHDAAVGALTRAIELTGSRPNPQLFTRRGEAPRRAGRLDEPIADLDSALAAIPDDARLWTARARARFAAGTLDEALADVRRASELAPGDYILVSLRAAILQTQGDLTGFAEAARILDE